MVGLKDKLDPLDNQVKKLEDLLAESQRKEGILQQEKSDLLLRNDTLIGEKQKLTDAKEVDRLELRRLKKARKTISRSEDRGFAVGYDDAVIAAHKAGFDYTRILFNPADDPVLRQEIPEGPLVVSSDPESE